MTVISGRNRETENTSSVKGSNSQTTNRQTKPTQNKRCSQNTSDLQLAKDGRQVSGPHVLGSIHPESSNAYVDQVIQVASDFAANVVMAKGKVSQVHQLAVADLTTQGKKDVSGSVDVSAGIASGILVHTSRVHRRHQVYIPSRRLRSSSDKQLLSPVALIITSAVDWALEIIIIIVVITIIIIIIIIIVVVVVVFIIVIIVPCTYDSICTMFVAIVITLLSSIVCSSSSLRFL